MGAASTCRIAWFVVMFAQLTGTTAWSQESVRILPANANANGKRHALLVACNYGGTAISPLRYAHEDILAFEKALRKRGFDNIVKMYDHKDVERRYQPEYDKIHTEVELLFSLLNEDDTLVVALSGHGVQDKDKHNYFLPVDADLDKSKKLLSLGQLYKTMQGCKAARKLLVVDACRNDPPELSRSPLLQVDFAPEPVPKGIAALFSCSPGEKSYEDPARKHGIFFYQLLRAWDSEAAVDEEGKLTLNQLVDYTQRQTRDEARKMGKKQVPHSQIDSQGPWVLWEPTVGELRRFKTASGRQVRSVALSGDEQRALSGGVDSKVRLWELATGKELKCLEGHTRWVRSVAFSPNGRHAVSGSDDKTVRLWDLDKGEQVKVFKGHEKMVYCVAFAPDGQHVLSAGDDLMARLWDVHKDQEVRCFRGHTDTIWSVAFSSDGRQILTGSADKTIRLWDAYTGEEMRCFRGHTERVLCVAFAPDDVEFLSSSDDRTVRRWRITGEEVARFPQAQPVISVAFSPNGRLALTGGTDRKVRLWDLLKGGELYCCDGHEGNVMSVVFSSDSRQALTGSLDGTSRLWGLPRK